VKLTFDQGPVCVGMVHMPPLPGSPMYQGATDHQILAACRADLAALLAAGFPAVSFSNEADRPYLIVARSETITLMTWLITELTRELEIPFGCGVLVDPCATLAVARAVKASFVRLTFGVFAGTFGIEANDPGTILRYRRDIGADEVEILMNVSPHFGSSLDTRAMASIVSSYAAMIEPAAVQVHGLGAGFPPAIDEVAQVKSLVGSLPVLAASGTDAGTVAKFLEVCDGTIVGSSLKYDGHIWNAIDPERARDYMQNALGSR
jgi:uncharacterized protein